MTPAKMSARTPENAKLIAALRAAKTDAAWPTDDFWSSVIACREGVPALLNAYDADRALIASLTQALRVLYEETADYIRLNNLGDVHHNRSMQMARAALAAVEGKA